MTKEHYPLTFVHPLCGLPAFHIKHIPLLTDSVRSISCEHIDGRQVLGTDSFACDSCRTPFSSDDKRSMAERSNYIERTE